MAPLLRFLRPHIGLALLALGLAFLAVAAQVGLIGTSAYLISRAALRPSTILLLMVPIVGVQFFSIGRSSLRYLERLTSHDLTFRLLASLRVWFYARLEALPPSILEHFHSADLLSRAVHDIDSLQDFYLKALAPPLVLLLTAALVWLVIRPMAPSVAWVLAVMLILAGLPAVVQTRLGRRLGGEVLRERGLLSAAVADGVRGVAELVAYGAGAAYQEKLRSSQRRLMQAQIRLRRAVALGGALIGLLGNLAMLAALVLAIPLVREGRMPGWDLAVVALVALAAFEAAVPLPQSFQAMGQCLAASRRIFDLAQAAAPAAEPREKQLPDGTEIQVRGLTVRREGVALPALAGVDLTLSPGRHVAVVGQSGAGKTTLIGALTGCAPVTEGSVLLGGVPITEIGREDIWAMSAVISQDTWLFHVSLKENIRLGRPDATDEEVLAAVEAVRLGPLVAALPEGIDSLVGEQGARLSGGERQRVAIARAMLKGAPVLLLDEPTEGLDAVTEEGVLQEILQLAQSRSLLLVTHRLIGLEAMDEILVLSGGRVVERGTHRELVQANGLYQQLFRLQADLLQEG